MENENKTWGTPGVKEQRSGQQHEIIPFLGQYKYILLTSIFKKFSLY